MCIPRIHLFQVTYPMAMALAYGITHTHTHIWATKGFTNLV